MLRLPLEFPVLAALAGFSYFHLIKKRLKKNQLKGMYAFFILWLSWTIECWIIGLPLVPRQSNIIQPDPSPQTIFAVYLIHIMYPALVVLYLVVIDITMHLLKQR